MTRGARTPEELETLLEDAFLARDDQALREMFEQGAVLVAGHPAREARGAKEIGRLARTIWERDWNYIADPQRVVQAQDTAVILANGGINVVRRGSDSEWRYAIALLAHEETTHEEEEK